MKNTAGVCQAAEVQNTQRVLESAGNIYLIKKETEVSPKLTIMLLMKKYKQLISEQRYAIYLGLEEGTSKKDIALRIGVHISTLYRELERNKKQERWLFPASSPRNWQESVKNAYRGTGLLYRSLLFMAKRSD